MFIKPWSLFKMTKRFLQKCIEFIVTSAYIFMLCFTFDIILDIILNIVLDIVLDIILILYIVPYIEIGRAHV